jgi:integrase
MRLNEMLSAKTENYNRELGYFIAGSKTEAGKDRVITISPKIAQFFEEFGKSDFLFFDKQMAAKPFRSNIFYPALASVGIDNVTPHQCRHTFATLMKNVEAPATDKQKLIGHAKFEMTAHYTHTDIDSLKKITDSL